MGTTIPGQPSILRSQKESLGQSRPYKTVDYKHRQSICLEVGLTMSDPVCVLLYVRRNTCQVHMHYPPGHPGVALSTYLGN